MSLRSAIKYLPVVGLYLEHAYRLLTKRRSVTFEVRRRLPKTPRGWIVQIGSNDGKTGDPLYPLIRRNKHWKCVFVEPVPYLFERLKSNYGNHERFVFVNAAINDGTDAPFFYIDQQARSDLPDEPAYIEQLGSFDRSHIIKHHDGILAPYLREVSVTGRTLPQLLADCGVADVDILHIDAEGCDWHILSQLDLSVTRPKLILFEHIHLAESEKAQAKNRLLRHYDVSDCGADYLCVRRFKQFENEDARPDAPTHPRPPAAGAP
jgi:FkbM family methyltransferase